MSQNHATQSTTKQETIRQATAYAYGYSLTMFHATNHDHYFKVSENLKKELKLLGCFGEETGNLKEEYFYHFSNGSDAAGEELEGGY